MTVDFVSYDKSLCSVISMGKFHVKHLLTAFIRVLEIFHEKPWLLFLLLSNIMIANVVVVHLHYIFANSLSGDGKNLLCECG